MWNVTHTLIPMRHGRVRSPTDSADDVATLEKASDLSTRLYRMTRNQGRDMASVKLVMQSLMALTVKTDRILPPAARQYLEGRDMVRGRLRIVPAKMVQPVLGDLMKTLRLY